MQYTIEQLKAAANHHEIAWRMYGADSDYQMWQHALRLLNQPLTNQTLPEQTPVPTRTRTPRTKPSPLKGRRLSKEHRAKLSKPKTDAQRAALSVPKGDSSRMGRYERTPAMRAAAAERARGRKKSPGEIAKIAQAKVGAANPKYKTYTFAVVHPKHGLFFGERMQLHKMHPELSLGELRRLALGQYPVYKGWRLAQKAAAPPQKTQ